MAPSALSSHTSASSSSRTKGFSFGAITCFSQIKKKSTKQTSNLLLAQPPPRYLSKHDAIVLQMGDRLMHGTKGVFPADVQGLTETTGVI